MTADAIIADAKKYPKKIKVFRGYPHRGDKGLFMSSPKKDEYGYSKLLNVAEEIPTEADKNGPIYDCVLIRVDAPRKKKRGKIA